MGSKRTRRRLDPDPSTFLSGPEDAFHPCPHPRHLHSQSQRRTERQPSVARSTLRHRHIIRSRTPPPERTETGRASPSMTLELRGGKNASFASDRTSLHHLFPSISWIPNIFNEIHQKKSKTWLLGEEANLDLQNKKKKKKKSFWLRDDDLLTTEPYWKVKCKNHRNF